MFVAGHAEQAVQAHATTPALEHAWQAVQEGAQVVQGHAVEAVVVVVQGIVLVVLVVLGGVVVGAISVIKLNHGTCAHQNKFQYTQCTSDCSFHYNLLCTHQCTFNTKIL